MKLEIVTPDQKLFEGEAECVTLPGITGQFQVLDRHAPLISTLEEGLLKVRTGTTETRFTVSGGVVEVLQNHVVVLAERAQQQ
ncbi:MAG: ATP synthase F1 subunit epsilon [Bernardetiaceae bacterium]